MKTQQKNPSTLIQISLFIAMLILFVGSLQFLPGERSLAQVNASYPIPSERAISTPINPYPEPNISPIPVEVLTPTSTVVSTETAPGTATLVVDKLNHFRLAIPEGWYQYVPSEYADFGATVVTNYNIDTFDSSYSGLPSNFIQVQISSSEVDKDQSFEEWIYERIIYETSETAGAHGLIASQPTPISFGDFVGAAVLFNDEYQTLELIINNGNFVTSIGVMPTNSALVDDALSFLSKIEFIGITTSINQNSQTKNPPIQLVLDDILRSGVASPLGTCPTGETYNGEEALESTILLHMPFTAGESWVVGGGGSFYGNGLHCNSNNDYYATDWNKPSGGDAGAWVLAVADGIVSDIVSTSCPVTGYGCYIQIDHDDGFRTVYAHLMEGYVYGTVDGAVRVGASIGRVGRTGTDNDHLHLRFLHDSGGYHSYCYNDGQTCPNGENPRSPQGYIPSPMDTSDGSTILVDGTIYKSVNGQTFVTDLRNKDGWVTTIYIRNSDISVRTVRIYYKKPNGSATPKDYDECTLAVGQWCWIPVNVYNRVESSTIASAYIEGGNELDVVTMHRKSNELDADNGFYITGLGDPAFEQAALDLYAPALYQNIWGWNPSKIYIMNTGESANTVSLLFKGRSGYQDYSGELEIAAKGFAEILTTQFVWSYPWTGSLVISNSSLSTRYPLVAQVVNTSSTDGKSYTYNASVAGNNLLYVPDAYKNNWTLTTGITIQNLDSYTADVDIFFYDRSGNLVTSYPLGNIAPLSCSGIQLSNITNLPDGFAGTAIVDGDGAILTGLVRGDRPGSGHYGHSITGLMSSYLIFPYMRRQTGGENSSILIQNAWSQGTTIELNYYSASGGYVGTRAYQMNARGATGVYLGNESWLGANWEGIVTAQVISYPRTTIVGVARNDLSNAISAYNGNVR